MTVATEASYAQQNYTGVETMLTPGFSALAAADVHVSYLDLNGLAIELTRGVHFSVALDAQGAVTVTPLAFPAASVLAPVTIVIERITPAVQGVSFQNLAAYDASVHEKIADAGAMRAAELRNRQSRVITPFSASLAAVDFRPRVVKVATPVAPEDASTKAYADLVSGTTAAAAASANAAAGSATAAQGSATAAAGSAASAAANAVLLQNPDYGFVTDAPTLTRDYGTIP